MGICYDFSLLLRQPFLILLSLLPQNLDLMIFFFDLASPPLLLNLVLNDFAREISDDILGLMILIG
jgi:hypothetical protein